MSEDKIDVDEIAKWATLTKLSLGLYCNAGRLDLSEGNIKTKAEKDLFTQYFYEFLTAIIEKSGFEINRPVDASQLAEQAKVIVARGEEIERLKAIREDLEKEIMHLNADVKEYHRAIKEALEIILGPDEVKTMTDWLRIEEILQDAIGEGGK